MEMCKCLADWSPGLVGGCRGFFVFGAMLRTGRHGGGYGRLDGSRLLRSYQVASDRAWCKTLVTLESTGSDVVHGHPGYVVQLCPKFGLDRGVCSKDITSATWLCWKVSSATGQRFPTACFVVTFSCLHPVQLHRRLHIRRGTFTLLPGRPARHAAAWASASCPHGCTACCDVRCASCPPFLYHPCVTVAVRHNCGQI